MPLVYIVMPCYNGKKYLLEQLMSIYYQNYTNWFLIFVNDWSTDSSEDILRDWISHYNLHDKVKVINKENWGVMTAIWRWLEEVKSMCDINNTDSLISYCDIDDVWTRDKLKIQVEYMVNHPECDFTYCDIAIINENNVLIESSYVDKLYPNRHKNFFYVWILWPNICSTMIVYKVKYIDDILPMDIWIDKKYQAQDFWTDIVMFLQERNIYFIRQSLVFYRIWHDSMQNKLKAVDLVERKKNSMKFYYALQERFPEKDISQVIKFNDDRYINWIEKGYSLIHIYILILYLTKTKKIYTTKSNV